MTCTPSALSLRARFRIPDVCEPEKFLIRSARAGAAGRRGTSNTLIGQLLGTLPRDHFNIRRAAAIRVGLEREVRGAFNVVGRSRWWDVPPFFANRVSISNTFWAPTL